MKLNTLFTDFIRKSVLWLRKAYPLQVVTAAIGSQDLQPTKLQLQNARDALRHAMFDSQYLSMKWKEVEAQRSNNLGRVCAYEDHVVHLKKQVDIRERRVPKTGDGIVDHESYKL